MALPLLALAAAPAAIQGISGLIGIGRGKNMARRNPFVTESVNQNLINNAAIAENAARVGTPQQQYNQQQDAINSNQAAGIRMLNRSNNPVAGVSSLVRQSNLATGRLNAQDSIDRQNNQRVAMQQRGILAGEQNRVWDWNNRQRYLQNAQAASQTINAGRQNLFGGIQGLSQLGQMALAGEQGASQQQPVYGAGISSLNNSYLRPSYLSGYGTNPFTPNV